jgi:hypothetical protein
MRGRFRFYATINGASHVDFNHGKPRHFPFKRRCSGCSQHTEQPPPPPNATMTGRWPSFRENARRRCFFVLHRKEEGDSAQLGAEPPLHERGDRAGLVRLERVSRFARRPLPWRVAP